MWLSSEEELEEGVYSWQATVTGMKTVHELQEPEQETQVGTCTLEASCPEFL